MPVTIADRERPPSNEFGLPPLLKQLDPYTEDARVAPVLSLIGLENRERQRSVMFNSGI